MVLVEDVAEVQSAGVEPVEAVEVLLLLMAREAFNLPKTMERLPQNRLLWTLRLLWQLAVHGISPRKQTARL